MKRRRAIGFAAAGIFGLIVAAAVWAAGFSHESGPLSRAGAAPPATSPSPSQRSVTPSPSATANASSATPPASPTIASVAPSPTPTAPALPANGSAPAAVATATTSSIVTGHYLYVLPDNATIYVYDIDRGHALVETIGLPSNVVYVRGFAADPASHSLYIAYKGSSASGAYLFKMDLLTKQVIYNVTMPVSVDSFSLTPDGTRIYFPDGDDQTNGIWRIVDAATGAVTGSIDTGGHNPHNTIVTLSGKSVLMGNRLSNYLYVADTSTNQIVRQVGPVANGVRPFTVNGAETLAFIETSGFIGFDVADLATGKILWTVPVPGYTYPSGSFYAPSHGISLSPDETEIYITDWPNSLVHVFDVTGLPAKVPTLLATIPVHDMTGNESPCFPNNCSKEGWVLHSRDGRFVYVGDAGDVIDATTRQSVAYLAPLSNTRKFLEIDWANGLPVSTTTRYGVGYVTNPASLIDTDGDGCPDINELSANPRKGGMRDPNNPWDFFDVPVPVLTSANSSGRRNRATNMGDVLSVLYYAGTAEGLGPNLHGVSYNTDVNNNGVPDGQEYDRTASLDPTQPWRSGPPDGTVTVADAITAFAQVGTNCSVPP